jgi:hypothetical protein
MSGSPELNRLTVTTFLTLIVVGLWIVTVIVRIWVDIPAAAVLDSAMPLIIGYWFVSGAAPKKNGNGAPA